MEHPRRKYVLIGTLVIILLVLTVAVSWLTKQKKNVPPNSQTGSIPTTVPVRFPKSYQGSAIPDSYFTQTAAKYQNNQSPPKNIYNDTADYIKRYFIYKDVLTENNIAVPAVDESSADAVIGAVPVLHSLVVKNLISHADFVYIKARFRLYPTQEIEDQVRQQIPNLQDAARQVVEKYREKLGGNLVNAQQILDDSNADPLMQQINYEDKNEYIRDYSSDQNLFFTDPNFNPFLFSQKRGTVSDIYELKQDGKAYAYLVVYPLRITVGKYQTVDDIINERKDKFTY